MDNILLPICFSGNLRGIFGRVPSLRGWWVRGEQKGGGGCDNDYDDGRRSRRYTEEGVATVQGGVAFTPDGTSLVYATHYPNDGVSNLVAFRHTTTNPGDTGSTTTETPGNIKPVAVAVVKIVDVQPVTPPILWTSPEVSGLVYGTPAYRTGGTAVYFTHNNEPFLGIGGGG